MNTPVAALRLPSPLQGADTNGPAKPVPRRLLAKKKRSPGIDTFETTSNDNPFNLIR